MLENLCQNNCIQLYCWQMLKYEISSFNIPRDDECYTGYSYSVR